MLNLEKTMESKKTPKKEKPKEKTKDSAVSKKATHSAIPAQTSRLMKQKYIRDLKNRPKDTGTETEQAPEEVEQGERWAVGELTSTTGRTARQGREYVKKKAEAKKAEEAAKDETTDPRADITPKDPPPVSPEAAPSGSAAVDSTHPETIPTDTLPHRSAPVQDTIPGMNRLENTLKERRQAEQRAVIPKERRLMEIAEDPPPGGKQPQPRRDARPLKERPNDYRIKERPLIDTPKPPDRSGPTTASVRLAMSGGTESEGKRAAPVSISPAYTDRKAPKMAVPMERRRELAEKRKTSSYAPRDAAYTVTMDIPADPDRSAFVPFAAPTEPFEAGLPLTHDRRTALKNTLVERSRKTARNSIKERPRFQPSQESAGAAAKPVLTPKARRSIIKSAEAKPRQRTSAPMRRAAEAAKRQAQRKMLTQSKKAVKSAGAAFKKMVGVAAKAVSAMTSAVTAIACGGILLTALVIVIVIAAVANSPFGLFYAQEPNAPDTVSVAQAVGSVKAAYNSRLEELQAGSYDSIDIQGAAPDWTEVLAVFAVKLAGAEVDGLDVATLDPDRVNRLTTVFWDMTVISTEVETIDHPASGNQAAWTEKILHITITPKTADDMRTVYNFTPYQNSALDELLSDRPTLTSLAGSLDITGANEREVLSALPADLEQARRDAVEKALSLVGKVNYFWGGKSRAIGWDNRWGTLQKVTAAGSPSTGTYRPFGLDCSGMIDWALRNAGLPSDGNWYIGVNLTRVSASEARPGDMALFPDASHIGIVVGRNDAGKLLVCHCSSGRNNVVVTEFSATGFTVVGRPNIYT